MVLISHKVLEALSGMVSEVCALAGSLRAPFPFRLTLERHLRRIRGKLEL